MGPGGLGLSVRDLVSLGTDLSGFLRGIVCGSFAEGGRFRDRSMRTLSPSANRLGGKYSNRTLIEVAEIPGLEETVIPLKGGAVPIEVKPNRRREDPRLRRGPIVERFGQLDLQEQRLRADAPAERERDRQRAASDFAVRQADTQRARPGERRAAGVQPDRNERRRERSGRRGGRSPVVVNAGSSPTVNITLSVQGSGGDRGEDILRATPEIEKRLTAAIELGTNRRLTNAIRGAVG